MKGEGEIKIENQNTEEMKQQEIKPKENNCTYYINEDEIDTGSFPLVMCIVTILFIFGYAFIKAMFQVE